MPLPLPFLFTRLQADVSLARPFGLGLAVSLTCSLFLFSSKSLLLQTRSQTASTSAEPFHTALPSRVWVVHSVSGWAGRQVRVMMNLEGLRRFLGEEFWI